MWKTRITLLILTAFIVTAFLSPPLTQALKVSPPPDVTLVVPLGLKMHFGDYWVYAQTGSDVKITEFWVNNWLNYTVTTTSQQQFTNSTKPKEVFIDGVTHEEGNGWTWQNSIVTVSDASTSVAASWVEVSQYQPPPPGGSQSSGGSSNIEVSFLVTDKGNPVEDARVTLYTMPYDFYYGTFWSDGEGKIVQSLETGEYRYEAEYQTLSTNGTFWHDGYDTVYIEFEPSQASHAPLSVNLLVIIIAVLAIFAIIKVRKS